MEREKRGRKWNYQAFYEECVERYNNTEKTHIVTYDFRGRTEGEMPKMFYRHLKRAREKGLMVDRIEQSVYHTSEAGRYFLVQLVKDFNHGASSKVFKAELEAID